METIIIYGSKYGSSKKYAIKLSNIIKGEVANYKDVKSVFFYNQIIYFGGLYAGGVLGLSKTLKLIPKSSTQNIIIITVGLSDPEDDTNTNSIKASIQKQIPKAIYDRAHIFHLRGSIDYSKLNFIDKTMIKLLYNKAKKLPPEDQNSQTKAIIEAYNEKVNFVDLDSLPKVVEILL